MKMTEKDIIRKIKIMKNGTKCYEDLKKSEEDLEKKKQAFAHRMSAGTEPFSYIENYIDNELQELRLELCELRGD